ncbi:MAG: hypothetical protein IKU67_03955 [Firmicutes bacterium]|nr:hypothetical protein [Bacillota bacterium]
MSLVIILVLILGIRLFVLTVVEHNRWDEVAEGQNTKYITTSAPRGEILDKYGRVIATNKQVFALTFNVSGLSTDEINDSAYSLVKILEANKEEYVDNFPIRIVNKEFVYSFDIEKKEWLAEKKFPSYFTAEQAFNAIRIQYEIDPKLDRYDAMEELQDTYGVYPPISVRSMTYTFDNKKKEFLEKYELKENSTAEEAFEQLRELYSIDKKLSNSEARKIFRIREEIKELGYNKYRSSTIAKNISDNTVIQIEEMSDELKGADIVSETIRYYPNGATLAHVLGYMGSISDYQYEEYVTEKGYNATDLIGKDGIEAVMEDYLKGTDGVTAVRVNNLGDYIETISESEPKAGQNVYLTIDLDLQKVAEDGLAEVIRATQTGTTYKGKYGNSGVARYPNCESGAVVAVDVETGEVLAMASYPDYDPNIFAEGISTEDWASVQSANPRDYLAPTPLYNIATMTSVQPGSTFKPITSVAALQAGLDPHKKLLDRGGVEIGGRTFGCYVWNNGGGTDGWQDLATGLQNSCNYYFYCIATGKDAKTGESLGFREEISIEKIMGVAKEFGLGLETGIEISETVAPLASAERKMEGMKDSLWYYLYSTAVNYWPQKVIDNEEQLQKEIDTIVSWTEENPTREEIIDRIEKQTSIIKSKVETVTDICKYSYFNQASWTIGDEYNISIGQGDNSYTVAQMARYVATLGNDGLRNELSLIKNIEGEKTKEEKEQYQIDVTEDEMAAVLEGMRRVTKAGTLAGLFDSVGINAAGKTGTAEVAGYIQPDDEVAYVQSHLSSIAPGVTWDQVAAEMKILMREEPENYPTENDAVDKAVIEASGGRITMEDVNKYKDTYDEFAWTVTLAPVEDPKIAVVVMLVQGGTSANAGPVAKDIIAEYLLNEKKYAQADFSTKMQ